MIGGREVKEAPLGWGCGGKRQKEFVVSCSAELHRDQGTLMQGSFFRGMEPLKGTHLGRAKPPGDWQGQTLWMAQKRKAAEESTPRP